MKISKKNLLNYFYITYTLTYVVLHVSKTWFRLFDKLPRASWPTMTSLNACTRMWRVHKHQCPRTNIRKAIASLCKYLDFFSTPLDDGLDNQWEESGWWAVGAVDHLPIQVGYWTSPISSWTLSIRIVSEINLLLYKWKIIMSSNNLAALEWANSYDIYPPCMHCSFKLKPSSMCSILFCSSWLTQHYSTNPTYVVDPMNQRNLCKA